MRNKMTVMILPVGLRCNLFCRYCYHNDVPRMMPATSIMSDAVLEKIIENASQVSKSVDFLWHGGEPLLAGMAFFKKAIAFQAKTPFSGIVRNIVQTNGTPLHKNFAKYLADSNFIVSTSLDGTEFDHNANRYGKTGQGTYQQVMTGIKNVILSKSKIGAVVLITTTNVNKPQETYDALKHSGISGCAFHVCSGAINKQNKIVPSTIKTARFLKKTFDFWWRDDNPDFPIRNFRNVLRVLAGGQPIECASRHGYCKNFIAVNINGDVYPCHRFVNRLAFTLGNIKNNHLAEIYENSQMIYDQLGKLAPECYKCDILKMCGGGCAFERYESQGRFDCTHPECQVKKELSEHIRKIAGQYLNPK